MRQRRLCACVAQAMLLCAAAGWQAAQAQSVTGTGDVDPSIPGPPLAHWDLGPNPGSNGLFVGLSGAGTLNISGGGSVTNGYGHIGGFIGRPSTANGLVTVSGAGSLWRNTESLTIGDSGQGRLVIDNGGTVRSEGSTVTIGGLPDSEGFVTVTGAGSLLQGGVLYIGGSGSSGGPGGQGTLTVTNGGTVRSGAARIGVGSEEGGRYSAGTVTVAGAGALWEIDFVDSLPWADAVLSVGVSSDATVIIGSGGRISAGRTEIGPESRGEGKVFVNNGGILETGSIRLRNDRGALSIDGGVLRPKFNYADNFMQNFEPGDATLGPGGVIIDSNGFELGIGAPFSGAGGLQKTGLGTLTLSGSQAYTGATVVRQGTLSLNGSIASSALLTVESGGTLTGIGTVGDTRVDDGGRLALGIRTPAGGLRVEGDLTLAPGALLDYDLGAPGSLAVPGLSGRLHTTGDLTLDGTLNLVQSTVPSHGLAGRGYYRLMSYEQALHDHGLSLGDTPALDGVDFQILAGDGRVDLFIAALGDDSLQHWQGGDGAWNTAGTTWINTGEGGPVGDVPMAWAGKHAVFKNMPGGFDGGTVSVEGAQSFQGLQFVDEGYRLEGPGELVTAAGGAEIRVLADTAEIATAITGADGIVKTEAGTLVLSGQNRHEGGTTLAGGTVSVAADANLGHEAGALNFEGGVLRVTGTGYAGTDRAVTLGALGGGIEIAEAGHTLHMAGDVAGAGDLVKRGDGTLRLSGNNAYGNTVIERGQLIGDAGSISGHVANGGVLVFDQAGAGSFAGDITGSGDLVKRGEGVLRLTGSNAYGNTVVERGRLIGSTGSISGHIANAGVVVFDQAGDAAFAGNIDGLGGAAGTMVKEGAGTLRLDGASALDWTVAGGRLEARASRYGGNARLDGAASTLAFTDTGDVTYGGVLSGNGLFSFEGGGTLRLSGDSSGFAGSTAVRASRLMVGGADGGGALGGSLAVLGGSVLGGFGKVGSGAGSTVTIAAGGTLAPGNSMGTLTVDGDLVFDAGSRYVVEVDPEGTRSDRVVVTGSAVLNGGSVVHAGAAGNYKLRSSYNILSAGSLSGKFGAASSDFAFLRPDLRYDYGAGTVDLQLARNDVEFASAARTFNQKSTAAGIETIGILAAHPVYDALALMPADGGLIRASFDAFSGEIHASAKTALAEDSRFIRDAAQQRMRAAFAAPGAEHMSTSAAPDAAGPVFWSHVFGSWGETDSDGNAASLSRDIGGFLVGADRRLGDWRVGLMGGYSHSSIQARDRASSARADSYHLGLYAGTQWGPLALRSGMAYTWHDIDTRRVVSVPGLGDRPSAGYRGHTFQAFGELGYGIDLGAARLEPFAGLAHVRTRTNDYREEAGPAALSGRGDTLKLTFATLGIRGEYDVKLGAMEATLRAMLGWRHAFGDTVPGSTHAFSAGHAFAVEGVPVARNSAVVEAGLGVNLSRNANLGVSYAGQLSGSARDHGVKARLAVWF